MNDALVEANASKETCQAQLRITNLGKAALSTAKLRYETGVDSYLRLMEAQVRYSSALLEDVDAWARLNASRIHLFKALGAELPAQKAPSK